VPVRQVGNARRGAGKRSLPSERHGPARPAEVRSGIHHAEGSRRRETATTHVEALVGPHCAQEAVVEGVGEGMV